MPCSNYEPVFQAQLDSSYPLGASSCTCYAGAMAGEYHTCGAKKPTGKRVRQLTGDTTGGTTLLQVDSALQRGWDINLDTRIGSEKLSWDQFVRYIESGKGAILQGSYVAIHGTKFDADPSFLGNHAIYVPPDWAAMDPLADGRRSGIYKYHGEAYPQEMLRKFAGLLELDPKKRVRLGLGWVWASLTRDNTGDFYVKIPARKYYNYIIKDGEIVDRELESTRGFVQECSAPKLYSVSKGSPLYKEFKYKRLVRITNPKSIRYGFHVGASYAQER